MTEESWKELHLSWNDPRPWAEQLRDQIRLWIQQGRLKPGERLPPVRQLARWLGVNFNTVARAYRLLAQEGWVRLRHGRGAYVQPPPEADHSQAWRQEALEHLARHFVQQASWLGFSPEEILQAVDRALGDSTPDQKEV